MIAIETFADIEDSPYEEGPVSEAPALRRDKNVNSVPVITLYLAHAHRFDASMHCSDSQKRVRSPYPASVRTP